MSDIMGLWVILRVEIVHGRQCTMSMEFVHSFMRRCWKNSMDNVHSTLDIVPGFHGHCPHIPWVPWTLSTHSMDSMDNVHAFCGKYPWIPWKMSRMSMESMDFLQTGTHMHLALEKVDNCVFYSKTGVPVKLTSKKATIRHHLSRLSP